MMKNLQVQTYSQTIQYLMIAFSMYLHDQNIPSPQEYFQKETLGNPNQITRLDFQKIILGLQLYLSSIVFSIIKTFNELQQGPDCNYISTKTFLKIYNQVHENANQKNKKQQQQEEKRRKQQEEERKSQIIRIGLKNLQTFILQNDSLAIFEQFDRNSTGKLNVQQFNKLLISSEIKEFEDKQIRKIILVQIYQFFPSQSISKQDYIKFFNIPKEKVQKKNRIQFFTPMKQNILFNVPVQPKVSPIKYKILNKTFEDKKINPPQQKITINNKALEIKNITFNKPKINGFKKKDVLVVQKIEKPIKENPKTQYQLIFDLHQNQLLDVKKIFPNSSVYFRNGQPPIQELKYFQELQNLLVQKKIYKDLQNPLTLKGQYYQSRKFFKGQNYKLFQMAQSVLQRQISRIGLARQIQPKDIIQGQLGDCYFLSAIASLISIYPQIIAERFLFNQNLANYFVVKIFIDGQWKYLTTDDCFPSKDGKNPVFARPHGKQIWVMLLEKCWAKCFGNFQAIVSGNTKQAFIALTGAPTEYYPFDFKTTTKQDIEQRINKAFFFRNVVTASGSDYLRNLSNVDKQRIGLVSNHAYSFLKFVDANGERLVKLRNPWGNTIWKGQWSFESTKWTKQLRSKFNYHRCPQDGSFYMSMDDFLKYFGSVNFCKVNPIYSHTSLNTSYKNHKSNYTKMKVKQSGRYIISLYQKNERDMKQKIQNYNFSPVRIILMKMGQTWEYIDSIQERQSYSTSIEVDLEEGIQYMISTKVTWKLWDQSKACLTAYGPEKVVFEPQDSSIAPLFKNQMVEQFFKKNRGKVKYYEKTGADGSYSEFLFNSKKGIGYYFITNPSDKEWSLTYNLESQGIKPIKPEKLPFTFQLKKDSKFLRGFFISHQGSSYKSWQNKTF